MCHSSCIEFAKNCLISAEVTGKSVIEVGSYNVNGSVRPIVEVLKPAIYLGVDIQPGPGVDYICDVNNLVAHFGVNRFDLVISTELLEHVQNWRHAISNLKQITKPGGLIFITTRSLGFPYHGYPHDFWRYELSDIQNIFSDFSFEVLSGDYEQPGIFLKARKPVHYIERNTAHIQLYSMVTGGRTF